MPPSPNSPDQVWTGCPNGLFNFADIDFFLKTAAAASPNRLSINSSKLFILIENKHFMLSLVTGVAEQSPQIMRAELI